MVWGTGERDTMLGVAGDGSRAMRPCEFVVEGCWPYARLAGHHGARVAQGFAQHLAEAMDSQSLSANRLGSVSGVNRQTIANVLAGTVWPDLLTIANLENALGARLWPDLTAVARTKPIQTGPI